MLLRLGWPYNISAELVSEYGVRNLFTPLTMVAHKMCWGEQWRRNFTVE